MRWARLSTQRICALLVVAQLLWPLAAATHLHDHLEEPRHTRSHTSDRDVPAPEHEHAYTHAAVHDGLATTAGTAPGSGAGYAACHLCHLIAGGLQTLLAPPEAAPMPALRESHGAFVAPWRAPLQRAPTASLPRAPPALG